MKNIDEAPVLGSPKRTVIQSDHLYFLLMQQFNADTLAWCLPSTRDSGNWGHSVWNPPVLQGLRLLIQSTEATKESGKVNPHLKSPRLE